MGVKFQVGWLLQLTNLESINVVTKVKYGKPLLVISSNRTTLQIKEQGSSPPKKKNPFCLYYFQEISG